jgi:hypothetical protein
MTTAAERETPETQYTWQKDINHYSLKLDD